MINVLDKKGKPESFGGIGTYSPQVKP